MVKQSGVGDASDEHSARCRRQIVMATITAVVLIGVAWWIGARLGWFGY